MSVISMLIMRLRRLVNSKVGEGVIEGFPPILHRPTPTPGWRFFTLAVSENALFCSDLYLVDYLVNSEIIL